MKLLLSSIAIGAIAFLYSCDKEEPQPNDPTPTPTNPADTTGNGTDTTGTDTTYTYYALYEMYKVSSDGVGMKNTVDSIRFTNQTTGYSKMWTASEIIWSTRNGNYYGGNFGNYTLNYIPKPLSGEQTTYTVYFNVAESRMIKMSYNDAPGFSSMLNPITGANGLTFVYTKQF